MYLLLYRCRIQLEDRIRSENTSLSRKQVIVALRNTLGEGSANNNRHFKIYLNKCRRGEKVAKIVEIVGNGILQRHKIFWSKVYKLQQARFEELVDMLTFFARDPSITDQYEQDAESISINLAVGEEERFNLEHTEHISALIDIEDAIVSVPEIETEQNEDQSNGSEASIVVGHQIEIPETELNEH
jgi:hypothetical protein